MVLFNWTQIYSDKRWFFHLKTFNHREKSCSCSKFYGN